MSLISTYDVRLWLGTEEGDNGPNARLAFIAGAVEDFCDSYTNRKLEAKVYRTDPVFSWMDGTGNNYIYLPQYPVSYVSSVNVDANQVFGSGTLYPSSNYFWYPAEGKLRLNSNTTWGFDLSGGGFSKGRRNILIDYVAGYAPVSSINGTWNNAISSYPLPFDLRQVMLEMTAECMKEGMTAIHSIAPAGDSPGRIVQRLSSNSYWLNVLNKYKNFAASVEGRDE